MFKEVAAQVLTKIKPIEENEAAFGTRGIGQIKAKIRQSQQFIDIFGNAYRPAKQSMANVFQSEAFAERFPWEYLNQVERAGEQRLDQSGREQF